MAYVEVSIDSYAEPNGQDEATGFYSNITGITAGAEGGNNGEGEVDYAFPKTWITMVYDSDSSGTAHFTFHVKVPDDQLQNLTPEDKATLGIDADGYKFMTRSGKFRYANY